MTMLTSPFPGFTIQTESRQAAQHGQQKGQAMTQDTFRHLHSELIRQVQGIEYDLKLIYAAIKPGNFDENYQQVQNFSMGEIAGNLKKLDYSDNIPDLSEQEYDLIDRIRVIRNYWCHQCYVDFMYITNEAMKEEKFNEVCEQLIQDEQHTRTLFQKLEVFRTTELKTYGRI